VGLEQRDEYLIPHAEMHLEHIRPYA